MAAKRAPESATGFLTGRPTLILKLFYELTSVIAQSASGVSSKLIPELSTRRCASISNALLCVALKGGRVWAHTDERTS
jgi:hypothetical protein